VHTILGNRLVGLTLTSCSAPRAAFPSERVSSAAKGCQDLGGATKTLAVQQSRQLSGVQQPSLWRGFRESLVRKMGESEARVLRNPAIVG
jgi:hypothetical protein